MKVDLIQPPMSGLNDKETLMQMRSYLFQLREQLLWAFENVEATGSGSGGGGSSHLVQTTQKNEIILPSAADAEITFAAIKPLIIKSADIVDAYYTEIEKKISEAYVAESDFGSYVSETIKTLTETSERVLENYESIQAVVTDTKAQFTANEESFRAALEDESAAVTDKINEVAQSVVAASSSLQGGINEVNQRVEAAEGVSEQIANDLETLSGSIDLVRGSLQETDKRISDQIEGIVGAQGSINSLRAQLESEKTQKDKTIEEINTRLAKFGTTYGEVSNENESYAIIIKSGGYVKSGKIYDADNGIPVYGIEIGQTVEVNGKTEYHGFARFISGEISFFDENKIKAAWLSKRRLHAEEVEATKKQQIGGFVDIVDALTGDVTTVFA